MKKIATTILSVCMVTAVWAQNEKYTKAMEQKIAGIDTARSIASWHDLANSFERIADAERTQWLPYYYAALSHVMIGYNLGQGQTGGFADKTDPEAEKAESLISKAEAKLLFEEAMKKYESFKPESSIHPQWGISQVKYFHAEASK